jgi:hypothetical protein
VEECSPPSATAQCRTAVFWADDVRVDGAVAVATVCGLTLRIRAGTNSKLVQLVMGGVGADVQRRRSIATGAALSFEFDEAVSLGALVLSRVDANDRGLVELADRNVSVVADVTDLSGAGMSRAFAIRALQGDGFEFVRVEVVQSVPVASLTTSSATTDGSPPPPTTKTTTVAVSADSPVFVGSLPFWIMIGGIILVVICCIFITVLVVKLRQRIRDGDGADPDDKDVSMQKLGAAPQAQRAGDDAMVSPRRKIEAADLVAVEDISSSTEAAAMQLDGEYDESESYRVVGSVPLHEAEEQEGYESLPIYNYSATGNKTQEIKIHTIVDESTLQRATFAQVIEISESENDDADVDEARRRQSVILAPVDSDDDDDAVITISRVGSMSHANRSSSGKTKKKSLRKSAKRSHK